jgi:homoserine kinase
MIEAVDLTVPASIGNMGAGFDTLSVAVQLYLRVRIREIDEKRPNGLEFTFPSRPLEGENFIARAVRFMADRKGLSFPSICAEVVSDIPLAAGLGSSAAATVAGLRLFEHLTGPRPRRELLAAATELEGHPDNASAALLGGLVGSCVLQDGSVVAHATPWPATVRFLVLTPERRLSTAASREVLPEHLSRADAVYNLQRVALLLQSLESGDLGMLREALRDRWHQPYRQALVPGLERLLALEHPDLLGVCLSGSGPSIVGLAAANHATVERLMADAYRELGIPFTIRHLEAEPVACGEAAKDRSQGSGPATH